MLKNRCAYILSCFRGSHVETKTIRYGIILFVFCIITGALWANPFTGKKDTPAPVRTEKTADFLVNRQAQLHTKLGDSLYEWTQTNSVQAFWTIITLAVFYGIVHALGPGHRKTLIFSFYLTRQAPVWEPAITSLILAGLHGTTSVLLLLIFRNVSGALSVHTDTASIYLEGFSFILLMVLSGASILHLLSGAFPRIFSRFRFSRRSSAPSGKPAYHTGAYGSAHYKNYRSLPCTAGSIQWSAFLLSGMYPCPAALLVLVLVSTLDAAGIGIIAVIGISVGMAIPITIAAYLAWTGRKRLFQRINKTQKYAETAALALSLAAYSAIFILSLIAVLPFIKSVIR